MRSRSVADAMTARAMFGAMVLRRWSESTYVL